MKSSLSIVWITLVVICVTTMAYGEDANSTETSFPSIKMGMDTYWGVSDMPEKHSFTDGMWAGSGPAYPSLTYFQWESAGGYTAKLSLGVGEMYTDSETTLHQPVEAYWQAPAGKAVITVGKFWVPFAQQEWLYEAKPGIMARWAGARTSLTASANYNSNLHCPNVYIRGGYKVASDAELGLSYALGDGFCIDSIHERGIALDTTIGYAGWRLYGEYNHFDTHDSGNAFNYISGKLYYEKLGAFTPFVGVFSWNDRSDTFGQFRSTVYGLNYQVSPTLAIEGGVSSTSAGDVSWLQLHWNWQRTISSHR